MHKLAARITAAVTIIAGATRAAPLNNGWHHRLLSSITRRAPLSCRRSAWRVVVQDQWGRDVSSLCLSLLFSSLFVSIYPFSCHHIPALLPYTTYICLLYKLLPILLPMSFYSFPSAAHISCILPYCHASCAFTFCHTSCALLYLCCAMPPAFCHCVPVVLPAIYYLYHFLLLYTCYLCPNTGVRDMQRAQQRAAALRRKNVRIL